MTSLISRIRELIHSVEKLSVQLAEGVLEVAGWASLLASDVLKTVKFGVVGLICRYSFILMCILLAPEAKFITKMLNAYNAMFTFEVNAAISAVNGIVSFVNHDLLDNFIDKAATFFHAKKPSHIAFSLKKWKELPILSPNEVHDWLLAIPPTCTHFDSMPEIVMWFLRLLLGPVLCPITRLAYPLEKNYRTRVTPTLLGPFYTGTAAPVLFDPHANCEQTKVAITSEDLTCIVVGIPGYLYLELLLPLLIIRIVLPSLMPAVRNTVSIAWSLLAHDPFVAVTSAIALFLKEVAGH
jgi:hypothetical protein